MALQKPLQCTCGRKITEKTAKRTGGLCMSCHEYLKARQAENHIPVGGYSTNPDPALFQRVGGTAFRRGRLPS